jgi:hypothetical protein
MVYLKSSLVGVAALVSGLFLGVVGFIAWALWISPRSSTEGVVAYDVTSPWIGIPLMVVAGLTFLAGFSWEFRRAKRANRLSP